VHKFDINKDGEIDMDEMRKVFEKVISNCQK